MNVPVVDHERLKRLSIKNEIVPFNLATMIYLGVFVLTGLILFKRYQDKNRPTVFSSW